VVACVASIAFSLIQIDHHTGRINNQALALRVQLGDLQSETASLKQKMAAQEQIRASSVADASQLEILGKERDGAAAKAKALENSVTALARDRDELHEQLIGTRAELSGVSQNYAAVNRDLKSIRAELEAARAENTESQDTTGRTAKAN